MDLPTKLKNKLIHRQQNGTLRSLTAQHHLVDFTANDYLGFAHSAALQQATENILQNLPFKMGATGSRLISGNGALYQELETFLAQFFNTDAALVFNSGYDANLGFFQAVPQRGDIIFYDELSHASIRDGLQLSHAKSFKFKHNNLAHLQQLVQTHKNKTLTNGVVYVVTESVFSMDGDTPNLRALANLCTQNKLHLVVDEAHALGVFGKGLVAHLQIEQQIFGRIITFGKALGTHGAAVLGSQSLVQYLVNFARSLMYTTALPNHTLASIMAAFTQLQSAAGKQAQKSLQNNIDYFKKCVVQMSLGAYFGKSNSAIQLMHLTPISTLKKMANHLAANGYAVKPIFAPTVAVGQERLRFCIQATHNQQQIKNVLQLIAQNLS